MTEDALPRCQKRLGTKENGPGAAKERGMTAENSQVVKEVGKRQRDWAKNKQTGSGRTRERKP